ncbi:MAG: VOC family protein [Alistipes sp.]|nr:VOC family protein [Alistipes sp.]
MNIHHVGIYADDIENVKSFFVNYFGFVGGEIYHNPKSGFYSYMLSSVDGECRIEVMKRAGVQRQYTESVYTGLHHISLCVASKQEVDIKTSELSSAGFEVLDGPRVTGDGFYESSVRCVEGILIEICWKL